jgi:hypothetical protein
MFVLKNQFCIYSPREVYSVIVHFELNHGAADWDKSQPVQQKNIIPTKRESLEPESRHPVWDNGLIAFKWVADLDRVLFPTEGGGTIEELYSDKPFGFLKS